MSLIEIRRGQYRLVLLLSGVAVKLPRVSRLAKGLRCSRWENEVWKVWRHIFGWENLCPVRLADPFGLLVIMPRARQPVTESEMLHADEPDCHPSTDTEAKLSSFGHWCGRVVAIDYGIPGKAEVRERRAYYRQIAAEKVNGP
jgi:hypothetical protein